MAMLLGAEDVAGAADLQVGQRDLEARAKLRRVEDRLQPLPGYLRKLAALAVEQVRVRAASGAADPAAQLVELRQSKGVGAIDDDRVGIRDVEAGLDDRRAHKHVVIAAGEGEHDLLELALG